MNSIGSVGATYQAPRLSRSGGTSTSFLRSTDQAAAKIADAAAAKAAAQLALDQQARASSSAIQTDQQTAKTANAAAAKADALVVADDSSSGSLNVTA